MPKVLIILLTRNSQNTKLQKDLTGGLACTDSNNVRGKLLTVMKKHFLYHMTTVTHPDF